MEYKAFAFEATDVDLEEGYIKGYCAVMGNEDDGSDTIPFGAFRKTIAERGLRIKGGWQHDLDMPFAATKVMREVPRHELPQQILDRAPSATGGLYVEGKVSMNSLNRDRLQLVKDGLVDEMSIGYIPTQERFIKAADGRRIRELTEIKLFEWSCVTLGMNPAALVTEAKRLDTAEQPTEDEVIAVDPEQKAELTPAQKALRELLQRKASGETFDYLRQRVQDALEDAYPYNAGGYDYWGCPMMQQESDGPGCCIRDLYGDAVIVMDRDWDALWEIPFTLAANGDVTLDTAAARLVKVTYAPIPMTGEEAEKAIVDLAEVKAGRRNSRPDETRLKGAHDALHDVLNMPHHDMGGDSGSGDAEPDADDSAGEKAMMATRLKMIESRVRAASPGAA